MYYTHYIVVTIKVIFFVKKKKEKYEFENNFYCVK